MSEAEITFDAVVSRRHFEEFSAAFQKKIAHVNGGWINAFTYMVPVFVLSLAFAQWAGHVGVPRDKTAAFGPVEVTMLALVTGVFLSMILAWLFALRQAKAVKDTMLREGGNFLGPRRFTLDAEGIRIDGGHGHTLTRWSIMTDMTEATHTYLLWTDPGAAVMVPKDAFADEASRARFTAYVNSRIAKAAPAIVR